jgi:hypothetical protein
MCFTVVLTQKPFGCAQDKPSQKSQALDFRRSNWFLNPKRNDKLFANAPAGPFAKNVH